jgi:nucleoside-diphosphate-sugar epimerase
MTKRILVTGGAGMIGASLLPKLAKAGHDVIVVDDLSRGYNTHVPDACQLIVSDVAEIMDLDIGSVDVVFHLCSFMFGLGYSQNNHAELYDRNTRISDSLLTFMKAQARTCRMVFVSSSCVYPDDGPDCCTEETPLGNYTEMANLGYGYSKRHMEDRLRLASSIFGFPLSIVRPFNIYGEAYRWVGSFSQAIPMLVNKVMCDEPRIEVWGSGLQRRNYVHADDCAELLFRLGVGPNVVPLLNIGHQKTITLNDLTLLIATLAGRSINIDNNHDKPEGRFVKACSPEAIFHHFPDFEFSINLRAGLSRMIDWWYKEKNIRNT